MRAAIGELLRRESRWYPKVRVLVRKGKPGRHNVNDRIFLAIEKDTLAEHIPVSAESAQPQPVAKQYDVFRTSDILFGQKNSTLSLPKSPYTLKSLYLHSRDQ
jgi:hypothetical protein